MLCVLSCGCLISCFFLHGLLLQGVSVGTIKTKANVCCVQFPPDSGRSLAFGSADHKIYYFDLRNTKMPLCTVVGHNKTVSYVKFIDSTTLVSASTDNTLKLWDLSMCTSRVLDCPLQSFTGHLNVKVSYCSLPFPESLFKDNQPPTHTHTHTHTYTNITYQLESLSWRDLMTCITLFQNFVGLSVADGYVATGSETNEVCLLIVNRFYISFSLVFLHLRVGSKGEINPTYDIFHLTWKFITISLVLRYTTNYQNIYVFVLLPLFANFVVLHI